MGLAPPSRPACQPPPSSSCAPPWTGGRRGKKNTSGGSMRMLGVEAGVASGCTAQKKRLKLLDRKTFLPPRRNLLLFLGRPCRPIKSTGLVLRKVNLCWKRQGGRNDGTNKRCGEWSRSSEATTRTKKLRAMACRLLIGIETRKLDLRVEEERTLGGAGGSTR